MHQNQPQPPADARALSRPLLRELAGNAGRMMLLWVAFGVIVGLLTAPPPQGAITVFAFAGAGIIVLAPLGAVLGLLGGRRRDAALAAAAGALVGVAVGAATPQADLAYMGAMGLIIGGLVGTTAAAFFYRLPRRLLTLARADA